jgi:predicted lipoprotein with Yx(FWY)xxD motif
MARKQLILAIAAAAGAVAACSSPSASSNATPPPTSKPAASTTRNLPLDTANLQVAQVPGVGAVVSDDDGFLLYRYEKDTAQPPKSNCVETDCILTWSPLLSASGKVNAKGIDQSLLGTVERGNGLRQVTLAGWPLYRNTNDEGAGEANGNGVDGQWFAVSPDGGKAKQ